MSDSRQTQISSDPTYAATAHTVPLWRYASKVAFRSSHKPVRVPKPSSPLEQAGRRYGGHVLLATALPGEHESSSDLHAACPGLDWLLSSQSP